MSSADFIAIICVILGALIYSEQLRSRGSMKAVKELLELKMHNHDEKNLQQDKRMDWLGDKFDKHDATLGSHEVRIHDTEVSIARMAGERR
jgi:hypothetical protein